MAVVALEQRATEVDEMVVGRREEENHRQSRLPISGQCHASGPIKQHRATHKRHQRARASNSDAAKTGIGGSSCSSVLGVWESDSAARYCRCAGSGSTPRAATIVCLSNVVAAAATAVDSAAVAAAAAAVAAAAAAATTASVATGHGAV
ncbi:unnamed protein product [Closterium sp. NIES-53]